MPNTHRVPGSIPGETISFYYQSCHPSTWRVMERHGRMGSRTTVEKFTCGYKRKKQGPKCMT
ncbi:hypothetical protein PROFUN_06634 [Planoprotostelium fungivorum]|uniref:Uncharacterized protein n=1 Tax=Planoprotostelium fungivorum TaxID=1890364 RepID=A0A2P6MSU7_9EUKA|nr:hypothetical protein PROFUN_06634 [Planoprotostelium fungivorum]